MYAFIAALCLVPVALAASTPVPFGRPAPSRPGPPSSSCQVPTLPSPLAAPSGSLVAAALGVGVQVRWFDDGESTWP